MYVCVCVSTMSVPGAHRGQERASDPLDLELQSACELPYARWESNLGPRE